MFYTKIEVFVMSSKMKKYGKKEFVEVPTLIDFLHYENDTEMKRDLRLSIARKKMILKQKEELSTDLGLKLFLL
jgi:hypothetical protein